MLVEYSRERNPHDHGEEVSYTAIQDVVIAILGHLKLDVPGIAGRHIRLSHEERRPNFAIEQGREPFRLLGGVAEFGKDLHVPSIRGGAVHCLRVEMLAPCVLFTYALNIALEALNKSECITSLAI